LHIWKGRDRITVTSHNDLAAATGYVDEAIQYFLPNRVYDLRDVGFNALAGFGGIVVFAVLHWVKACRMHPDG